ncbi:hypothetical protein D9M70_458410 [compost metagenome]
MLREGLALGLEDLPSELLEFQLELAAALLEQLLLFDEMLLLLLQGAAQGGVLLGQVGELFLQHLMAVLLALMGLFEFLMLLQQLCMLGPCGTGLTLRLRKFGAELLQLIPNPGRFLLGVSDLALQLLHMRLLRPRGSDQLAQFQLLLLADGALLIEQHLAILQPSLRLSPTHQLPEQSYAQGQHQGNCEYPQRHSDIVHSFSPSAHLPMMAGLNDAIRICSVERRIHGVYSYR